jgi:hypothetical protein
MKHWCGLADGRATSSVCFGRQTYPALAWRRAARRLRKVSATVTSGRGITAGGYAGAGLCSPSLTSCEAVTAGPRRLAMPAMIAGRDPRVTRGSGPICGNPTIGWLILIIINSLRLSEPSRSDLVLWQRSTVPACLQIFQPLEVDL